MAWFISIQDFMRKVNYNSNSTESPCPTSFPFLTFIFLLEILSCDNPDYYFFFLAGVLELRVHRYRVKRPRVKQPRVKRHRVERPSL